SGRRPRAPREDGPGASARRRLVGRDDAGPGGSAGARPRVDARGPSRSRPRRAATGSPARRGARRGLRGDPRPALGAGVGGAGAEAARSPRRRGTALRPRGAPRNPPPRAPAAVRVGGRRGGPRRRRRGGRGVADAPESPRRTARPRRARGLAGPLRGPGGAPRASGGG